MIPEDKNRVIKICDMLRENEARLARINNGEENVPDFNRPQSKEKAENGRERTH